MQTTNHTSRMAALLGRLRREMNGAVAEAMARGGICGLLNYGVSIPTIVEIVRHEERDHDFARFLYRQQVRELRIAALLLASVEQFDEAEAEEWLTGAVTLELRDLYACYLLCEAAEKLQPLLLRWLSEGGPEACYTAIHALARSGVAPAEELLQQLCGVLTRFPESEQMANMVVRFFSFRFRELPHLELPATQSGAYVKEELQALFGE